MAGQGTYTAYQALKPLEGNNFIQQQEDLDYRRRQEKRYDDQLKAKQQEAADEKKAALDKEYNQFKGVAPTGIKSLDSLAYTWMDQVGDKRLQLYEKQRAGQRLTPAESSAYNKLEKSPETIALMFKSYQDEDSRYNKAVAEGDIKRDLNYEQQRNAMVEGAVPFIDSEGNPTLGFDKDGDGKVDIVTFDVNTGLSLKPKYIKNIDYDQVLKTVVPTLEPVVNQDVSGFTTTKRTGLPVEEAKNRAQRMVYSATGAPSDLAVSYFYDSGIEPENITPEMLKKYETQVAQDLMSSVKRGKEVEVDNTNKRLAEDARRDREKEDKTYNLNDLNNTAVEINTVDGKSTRTANAYQGNVDIKRKVGKAEETFKSFRVGNDGKLKVIVNVAAPDPDNIDNVIFSEKEYNSKGQGEDVGFYAVQFINPETGKYVKDTKELERYLNKRGKSKLGAVPTYQGLDANGNPIFK